MENMIGNKQIAERILDKARILEVRNAVYMTLYALMDDEGYTKEDAAKDLYRILEPLDIIDQTYRELDNQLQAAKLLAADRRGRVS